jgi:periplasmic copper chaperone A
MTTTTRRLAALGTSALAAGLLSACASGSSETAADPQGSAPGTGACPITVADAWVKAQDTDMTGAFGVLQNAGDAEVTVVSATSPQAGRMEIHEVVDKDGAMVMQPKAGGLLVPAGGSATLQPGSDHLMLMDLPAPIQAGDEVAITVTCDDGGTATWTSVAKPFEGGEETYVPEGGSMEMSPSPSAS